jgi:hypothetical protein
MEFLFWIVEKAVVLTKGSMLRIYGHVGHRCLRGPTQPKLDHRL